MIYNSNPYKRKMESMQVNVASSAPSKSDEPTKPIQEQVPVQETMPDPVQPVEQPVPPIEVTPYVPEVEGVEVPTISLDDIEPSNPIKETVEEAQSSEESPAEVEDKAESNIEEEAPAVVDSSELSNSEQAEAVVDSTPVEEAKAETPVDATSEEATAEVPATHYFYCTKPDGKEVVYKRNTASASYESEITSFRKYLEKEGIVINKEEIK